MPDSDYRTTGRMGRRPLIQGAGLGALGLAASALLGCGGSDEATATPGSTAAATSSAVVSAGVGKLVQGAGTAVPLSVPGPARQPEARRHLQVQHDV